ncbi:helix-turn-helix transcriptional regulator [Anaerotignum faecicola]|nr:helix-turn-helix transcriptional regulator [Anaerotignum faecicola]
MDKNFISNRIDTLCYENNISKRKLSLYLGKSSGYITGLTNCRNYPSIEALIEICDYFKITLSEFFDAGNKDIIKHKAIIKELERVCGSDIESFIKVIRSVSPEQYSSFISFLNGYSQYKGHD